MKPPAEMNEGPEALARFENTMKALFSKRKETVLREKRQKPTPSKTVRKSKA